ncbi:hypothetical protein HRI_003998200 [Hibiscus trionum]|uniref:Uncharacterized protein n=1 Tax=Hibiscus trionum TaxID=183268 RepID=A0A9W7IVE0_HIBTR|nr:hypothetical protein HRI_003998200 [Hibiscus trionum]
MAASEVKVLGTWGTPFVMRPRMPLITSNVSTTNSSKRQNYSKLKVSFFSDQIRFTRESRSSFMAITSQSAQFPYRFGCLSYR